MSETSQLESGEVLTLLNEVHAMRNVWSGLSDFIFLEKLEIFLNLTKR